MARSQDVLRLPRTTPADEVPLFGDGRARRARLRRRILAASAAVLAVILLGGVVFVVTQRNVATTVSFGDAVERFRAQRSVAGQPDVAAQRPSTVASKDTTADAPAVADAPQQKVGAAAPIADPKPYMLPGEGVYTYRTTGWESVSMFNSKHTYPDQIFSTVTHLGGCKWEHRSEVLEEHVDTRHFCGSAGRLEQLMQQREVTFFGTTDGGKMTCKPSMRLHFVGEAKGTVTATNCSDGGGSTVVATRTFQGVVPMDIGAEHMKAIKLQIDSRMTGRVDGESADTLWLHPVTGMTLRWDRTVDTLASAFGAKVRYKEDASFVLESLEPQR